MRISCVVFICVVLAFAIASPAFSAGSPQEEMNKKNAVEFYEKAINQKDFDGASKYIGSR
jgi:hypothetical protein